MPKTDKGCSPAEIRASCSSVKRFRSIDASEPLNSTSRRSDQPMFFSAKMAPAGLSRSSFLSYWFSIRSFDLFNRVNKLGPVSVVVEGSAAGESEVQNHPGER